MSESIKIPKLPDRKLVQVFQEIKNKYECQHCSVSLLGGINLSDLPDVGTENQFWQNLLNKNQNLIQSLRLEISGFTLSHCKGFGDYSAIYDSITFEFNPAFQNPISIEDRVEIISFLSKELNAFDPERSLGTVEVSANKHLEALHQSTLEKLELLAADLIREIAQERKQLDQEYEQRRTQVENELRKRKEQLADESKTELLRIEEREEILEQKLKDFDDHNNTHVRRQIREGMLDDVKSRINNFGVSRLTESKRIPVKIGFYILIFSFIAAIIVNQFEISRFDGSRLSFVDKSNNEKVALPKIDATSSAVSVPINNESLSASVFISNQSIYYVLLFKVTALFLGLIGVVLYYIRWENRWAEQHSNSEFQLQQFYIDVNRANWMVESGLEWRKETSAEMPDVLLQSMTKNLFSTQNELPPALHPADELASALLGSASKLKLQAGNNELEFDKPGKTIK